MMKTAANRIQAALALLLLAPIGLSAGTVSYSYDALHRLTAVSYPDGSRIQYSYDPAGNRTQKVVSVALDTDGDGDPDATDPDDDNDGYEDGIDAFPRDPDEWRDTDENGLGDNADSDDDGDSVDDVVDNCPLVANVDQADLDRDGIGDVCDGSHDTCDSAPLVVDTVTFGPGAHTLASEQLPESVQALLVLYAVDLDTMAHLLADADGWWLLFETPQDILPNDGNGVSDIYRLDLFTEALTLLSRTAEGGVAGNGPSRYPAADAIGELVVFQSAADDLVTGDNNAVTDIFLHDVPIGETSRLTLADAGAAEHPALDAAGEDLLYDRRRDDGQRQVMLGSLWDGTWAEAVSLKEDGDDRLLDNHHPAISADGRYVAYLEVSASKAEPNCQVHVYDRDTGWYQRTRCPDALAADPESARPYFSAGAAEVLWYFPGAEVPVVVPNPLLDGGAHGLR